MEAINAIFDGSGFVPVEPIPVKGKYEVIITFTKPVDAKDSKCQRILRHFGTWDDGDVETIRQVVEERSNFSASRPAYDFS